MNSSFLPFYLLGLRCKLFRPCLLDLSCKCAKRAPSGGQVPHDAWPYRSCKICPRLNAINVFGELKLIILLAVLARTITILLTRKNLCRAHDTDLFYTPATTLSKVFTLKLRFYLENRDFRSAEASIDYLAHLLFLLTSAAAAPPLAIRRRSHSNILLSSPVCATM